MKVGFITGATHDLYRSDILAEKHEVGLCLPPFIKSGRPSLSVSAFMARDWDVVICGDLGLHTAAMAVELEDRKLRAFNGGSIHAYAQEDPSYLQTLAHRVGIPIGGRPSGAAKVQIAVLMSRKGPQGPAFLLSTASRLGPVRCPGPVLLTLTPFMPETRLYNEVCQKVGKIFSSFLCSGVAVLTVDVGPAGLEILEISLHPPDGFWAVWNHIYAGTDVAQVFAGLATGKEFNYPIKSEDAVFTAALLTVPPYPTTHMFRSLGQSAALESLVEGTIYTGIGEDFYCVDSVKTTDGILGHGVRLGWQVLEDTEQEVDVALQLLAKDLDEQYIQVPPYVPGIDFAYVRRHLAEEGYL